MQASSSDAATDTALGLEGVVVAETTLSCVDGAAGRLLIRGHDVEQLAGKWPFEAVCGLLWEGALPRATRAVALQRELGQARARAFRELPRMAGALGADTAMEALRGSVASLGGAELAGPDVRTRLSAALPVFAAAWWRQRQGLPPIAPDPARGHAEDFLRMVQVTTPAAAARAALDRYLVSVAEHGMNASTFAARVVASTGSDATSAVVAALGALKGPLHGGAPGPVLDMLDAIGTPERAEAWLLAELDAGRRIMGLGHRVYRVRDPRAAIFESAVADLVQPDQGSDTLALARAVEQVAVRVLARRYPERRLATNVEFYTAVLLHALELPRELFTAIFACGRVAGWLAHVEEQRQSPRIMRPRQRYVGPPAVALGT